MRACLLPALAGLALAASAAGAEPRDVAWFVAHPMERLRVDSDCRLDLRRAFRDPECGAAERAGWEIARQQAQRAARRGTVDTDLTHTAYWLAWPIARAATLRECAHPIPGNLVRPSRAACLAAAEAQLLSRGGR